MFTQCKAYWLSQICLSTELVQDLSSINLLFISLYPIDLLLWVMPWGYGIEGGKSMW